MDSKFWQNNFSQTSLFKMQSGKYKQQEKQNNKNKKAPNNPQKQKNWEMNQSLGFGLYLNKINRMKHEAHKLPCCGF